MAEFGVTAWGRAWLRTVERTRGMPDPRLPKARSLARNESATLDLTPGLVAATVKDGSNAFAIRLQIPPWPDQATVAARVRTSEASQGAHAGDLPDSLATELTEAGIAIAVPLEDVEATCTCRTRKRPCTHILATIYALALRVDERPRLAIELRTTGGVLTDVRDAEWIALGQVDPTTFYG